jgi:hypothetical protein
MMDFLADIVKLFLLIFGEFTEARSKAQDTNQQFQLSQTVFHALVQQALLKMRQNSAKDSLSANTEWDQADQDKKSNESKPK